MRKLIYHREWPLDHPYWTRKGKVPEPFSIQIIFNYSIIDLPELTIFFFRPSHSKWITSWTLLGFNFMLYYLVIHQYSRTGYSVYGRLAKTLLLRRWNMHRDSWPALVVILQKGFAVSGKYPCEFLMLLNITSAGPVCPFNFFYHQKKSLIP